MGIILGLDYETYSDVNLKKHSLQQYLESPHFKPLLAAIDSYNVSSLSKTQRIFDLTEPEQLSEFAQYLWDVLSDEADTTQVAAHNSGFEIGVTEWIFRSVLGAGMTRAMRSKFRDTAVVSRAAGAGSSLKSAALQLLDLKKMDEGADLIKLFCIPSKEQEETGELAWNPGVKDLNLGGWHAFKDYCQRDAQLSTMLLDQYPTTHTEQQFEELTQEMNQLGWFVDMRLVDAMQKMFERNKDVALWNMKAQLLDQTPNLASPKQLKEFCHKRGIRATSFDEDHVESLTKRIEAKLATIDEGHRRWDDYQEVLVMLRAKAAVGGSSLKKLEVIKRHVSTETGRLHDQYVHVGAGQTYRTSGRSVQMQNLKRLGSEVADVYELLDPSYSKTITAAMKWTNEKLAENLRQVFVAEDPQGYLVVGDLSSIEARVLAMLAGQRDTLAAFRDGKDLYKVLAAKIHGIHYDDVLKPQRQLGKVGVLSCGYGAGAQAVKDFAAKMGTELTLEEAAQLVKDWRAANDKVEALWAALDDALHRAVQHKSSVTIPLAEGAMDLHVLVYAAPDSLTEQRGKDSISLHIRMAVGGEWLPDRIFHGIHLRGRNLVYYKPTDRKTGDQWSHNFVDPKTKRRRDYTIYGGKLSGILTQSFARELFFRQALHLDRTMKHVENVKLIGQFHDELVVEWTPAPNTLETWTLDELEFNMDQAMTRLPWPALDLPLAAEIKHARNYIK